MALLFHPLDISLRIFVIFGLLLLLGLLITRSSFTILDRFTAIPTYHPTQETPVLIYNSEEPGILLKQWLAQNKDQTLQPIGFLDDDPYKVGRQVTGIPVYGRLVDIEAISKNLVFEGILLAADLPLSGERRGDFMKKCASLGIWIKTSRLEFDLIE
jgi:FlaA1/EpsC-like NDP-sugar epimerase